MCPIKPVLAAAAMLCIVSSDLKAAEHWIHLVTPHFDMYTTNGEKQATSALKVFEQVRYFFLQNSNAKSASDTPVCVIAFRSEKEYKPYRTNEGSFAFYLRSRKVDYIVMQDISPEHNRAAMHEYTHLRIEHLNLKLPLWLNEGMAELYSSLEAKGNQAVVGRPLETSFVLLMNKPWLDLAALFAVDTDSPYYNERDKMSIFYAQSWALTHMIALGNNYQPGYAKFVPAIASGRPAAECFQSIYGKNLAQVAQDLHAYLGQASLHAAVFDVKLGKLDLEPEVSEPSDFSIDLVLADLLASQKKTSAEAFERLSKLAQAHPESADVQESLGYLAWQQGDTTKARESFKLASARGSKNPEMLVHYAQLLHESGAPAVEIIDVLQRAVAIRPDYPDALFNLGITAMNAQKWSTALVAFLQIKTVPPDRAYPLFSAQAYCYLQLKDPGRARVQAEKAKQYATSPDEQLQASDFLRNLDLLQQKRDAPSTSDASPSSDETGVAEKVKRELPRDESSIRGLNDLRHVEAVVRSFECNSKPPRLRVFVNSKEMIFEFDDPQDVIVRNGKNGSFTMQCGPQKPLEVSIFYVPPSNKQAGVDGEIRELVF